MTDAASPEAPKRITRNRPTKYPAQLAVMLEQEMYDSIVTEAEARGGAAVGVFKADVAREWLRLGQGAQHREDYPDGL